MNRLNKEGHHSDKPEQNPPPLRPSPCSRRTFLKQVVAIGAAGLIAPRLLMACSNENAAERIETETGPTDQTLPGAATSGKCKESADLPAGDVAARQAVNYVDESPQTDKICANCQFFKQPAAGAACGGCEIVKGPIAPEDYCNAWVVQS
ncbi:MAG: high-potential iron-sulfur protein [Chloroflexi bacterium]|nr:high-potential iron-sulfur protein [Chloroflexota bacterium]